MNIQDTKQYRLWHDAQTQAGNTVQSVTPLWQFNVGPNQDIPFAFAAHVEVKVGAEGRVKGNEFILSRPDICHVVLWHRPKYASQPGAAQVVLVREFRSTSRTKDGYIRECPGGSSAKDVNPRESAAAEVLEETGLVLDVERLVPLDARQLCGTFSTHKAHVFSYRLTAEEMYVIEQQAEAVHGNEDESERTYVEIVNAVDLLHMDVDWANVGMVFAAIIAEDYR